MVLFTSNEPEKVCGNCSTCMVEGTDASEYDLDCCAFIIISEFVLYPQYFPIAVQILSCQSVPI